MTDDLPEHCSDAICMACELRRQVVAYQKLRPLKIETGHFYWLLVEIDTDGRIDHQENFEILPGYPLTVTDDEPTEWVALRSMCGELELQGWQVTPLERADHKEPMWGPDGDLVAKVERLAKLFPRTE